MESVRIVGLSAVLCGIALVLSLSLPLQSQSFELFPRELRPLSDVKELSAQALRGDRESQCILGLLYSLGSSGLKQDFTEAARWFRKSADAGLPEAQANLAVLYMNGQGVPKDFDQAIRWFHRAAVEGSVTAQYQLGVASLYGHAMPVDYKTAFRWFKKSAHSGYPKAQFAIGFMYMMGYGVSKDYRQSLKWYKKSAEQGYAPAQLNLGILYCEARPDYAAALKWLTKAAHQGLPAAEFAIGAMHKRGLGVAQSDLEAERWFSLAFSHGYRPSPIQTRVAAATAALNTP